MPHTSEFTVCMPTSVIKNPVVRHMAALEPGKNFVDSELAVVDRNAGPGDATYQPQSRLGSARGGERRGPCSVDQRGIEIVDGSVRVEVAAGKYRPDQCCATSRYGTVELVDVSVLGGAQHVERTVESEILRVARPAVRRIKDQGHLRRLRVAAPQHTGDLEAHSVKLVAGCARRRMHAAPGEFTHRSSKRASSAALAASLAG